MSYRDQRAAVRVPFVAPAAVEIDGGNRSTRYEVETFDISPAGVGIVAVARLADNAQVRFSCDLPGYSGGCAIEVPAVVRWKAEVFAADMVLGRDCCRYGLEFTDVTAEQEAVLVRAVFFIETRQRQNTSAPEGRPSESAVGSAVSFRC